MSTQSKVCTKCNIEQPISEYRVNKGYVENVCKQCVRDNARDYRRTKDGLIKDIYSHQKQTSKKRGHQLPTYTQDELKDWMYSQEKFHTLYDNWKRLDYQTDYKPSVDRKDDRLGYTIANIQLMTWLENRSKLHEELGEEHNNKFTRGVKQYGLDGNIITEHLSVAEASRGLDIEGPHIIAVCKGYSGKKVMRKAKGFQFRYADEAGDFIGECPKRKYKGTVTTIQEELDRRKQWQ